MKITIAERLQPFSHTPGASCLIPGTAWQIQAFPLRFILTSPTGEQHVIAWPLNGPVSDFTLLQDLERGFVSIFGTWQEGFFLWQVDAKEGAIWLRLQRAPAAGCTVNERRLLRKEAIRIVSVEEPAPLPTEERLSFGSHKKQEWELMHRRLDLCEILPFWFRLAQVTPAKETSHPSFNEELSKELRRLFLAQFRCMFIPSLSDDRHQGFQTIASNPLHGGAKILRDALFREENGAYAILPALSPEWHCGRLINIATAAGDTLDLEWSKKQVQRIVLRPAASRSLSLIFPPAIKSFRVRTTLSSKGVRQSVSTPLSLEAGTPLFLDRFEK